MNAPITLFVYARPIHTRRTVESLLCNTQAAEHDLIIFSDAAQTEDKQVAVDEVRTYIASIRGFRSVTITYREHNLGLAHSIIDGVTKVLIEHESIIVLEDDMETSPHFLTYMDDSLARFADDERVISIHGYVFPMQHTMPEAFFIRGADCWGWATWRRGWRMFNPDGKSLLDELKSRDLINLFNLNGAYSYSQMLEGQIKGENDSWAVRWYASAFLAGKLTLYPGRSLVNNIGFDNSGEHCGSNSSYQVKLSATPIDLCKLEVVASELGREAFETFFRKSQYNFGSKIGRRIQKFFLR